MVTWRRLAAIAAIATAPLVTGAPASTLAAAGSLSIVSEPGGAAVYLDGAFVGHTPAHFPNVAAGDHRVRLARAGYLENGRTVAIAAGETRRVSVGLTPNLAHRSSSPAPSLGGGTSLLASPLFWAAAGGAAAVAILHERRNKAPSAGTIIVTPSGIGMLESTSFALTSQGAVDPNGDALSYSWNFGDLSLGTGQTTSHFYTKTGTFTVSLAVSDSKATVSPPAITVVVASSLSGFWTGAIEPAFGSGVSWNLTQVGANLGGSMTLAGPVSGTVGGVSGSIGIVSYPTSISVTATYSVSGLSGQVTTTFTGTADGTSLVGTLRTTTGQGTLSAPAAFHR
jgi:hypothetical protein